MNSFFKFYRTKKQENVEKIEAEKNKKFYLKFLEAQARGYKTKNIDNVKSYKLSRVSRVISCKNIYLFVLNKDNVVKPMVNLSLRSYFFFKFLNFFKVNGYDLNIVLKIFSREFKNLWYIFISSYKVNVYILLLSNIMSSYSKLIINSYLTVNTTHSIIRPSSFLIYNDFSINNNLKWCNSLKALKGEFVGVENVSKNDAFNVFKQPKFWILYFKKSSSNQFNTNFIIHFLRVQRRYNKRRYSRVRAISRPPFFAGISLSSILVACFWNSSIKSVDWFTSIIVVIDINLVLFLIISYFLFRLFKVFKFSVFIRKRGRSRILSILNIFFIKNLIKRFFR